MPHHVISVKRDGAGLLPGKVMTGRARCARKVMTGHARCARKVPVVPGMLHGGALFCIVGKEVISFKRKKK